MLLNMLRDPEEPGDPMGGGLDRNWDASAVGFMREFGVLTVGRGVDCGICGV